MAFGLKILAKNGTTVRLDTTSVTETIVDSFTVPEGTAATITKTYADVASDMVLSVAILQITNVVTTEKQLIPTVTINQSAKTVTVTGTSSTATSQQGITINILSTECRIIVLGK